MAIFSLGRHGHNELDNPRTTLPLTYEKIQDHPRVLDIYAAKLNEQGLTTPALLHDIKVTFSSSLPNIALRCIATVACQSEKCLFSACPDAGGDTEAV